MKTVPITKSETLKAKIGLSGPALNRIPGPAPQIPDHEMMRCIGQGSYGEVWLARNAVGTWRAVKVVYRQNFKDPRPYEREFTGIQSYEPISRSNEGLIDVLQIGRNDAAGYFYYIMELADAADPDETADELAAKPDRNEKVTVPEGNGFDPDSYAPKTLSRVIQQRGLLSYEECITLGLTLNLALGHLHRNGLIHRDVKPSNIIFVSGVPKLTDIGLVTDLAGAQSFVGTEGFIPPEGPNSPQADLYALGKVLYEASMGKDRNQFPEPMTALGINSESKALMELNAVLVRACAPDPKSRYQRAEEMNADLALLHNGESVRNKHALELRLRRAKQAATITLAVIVLAVIPYYFAVTEARHAREAARKSHEVAQFLKNMLRSVAPSVALGRDTRLLRDLVDSTAKQVGRDLKGEPEVEAELSYSLGEVYQELGEYISAEALLRRALALYRSLTARDPGMEAQCLSDLSLALSNQNKSVEAEQLQKQALAIRMKKFGERSLPAAESYQCLGYILTGAARLAESERMFRRALEIRQERLPADDMLIADAMCGVANLLNARDHWTESEAMYRKIMAMSEKSGTLHHPRYVAALNGLVASLISQPGKLKEAEEHARESVALDKELFPPEHPLVAEALTRLARVLDKERNLTEAKVVSEEALAIWRKRLSNQDPTMGETVNALLDILLSEGNFDETDKIYRELLIPATWTNEPNKSLAGVCGNYLARRGKWEESARVFSMLIKLEPANHHTYQSLAALYFQLGDFASYQALGDQILRRFGNVKDDPSIADRMAKSCMILPPNPRAMETIARLATTAVTFDEHATNNAWLLFCKGLAEYRQGDLSQAKDWMQQVLLHLREGSSRDVGAYMVLAMAQYGLKDISGARVSYDEGTRLAARRLREVSKGDIESGWTDWILAHALMHEAAQLLAAPIQTAQKDTANPR
jgi:tetratricopeptide (TPR) repeat protein